MNEAIVQQGSEFLKNPQKNLSIERNILSISKTTPFDLQIDGRYLKNHTPTCTNWISKNTFNLLFQISQNYSLLFPTSLFIHTPEKKHFTPNQFSMEALQSISTQNPIKYCRKNKIKWGRNTLDSVPHTLVFSNDNFAQKYIYVQFETHTIFQGKQFPETSFLHVRT
jgi:hypothetical protein